MDDDQSVSVTYTLPETGKFAPGNPGRPKGIKDRRARTGELVAGALLDLPKVKARVQSILESDDTDPRVFVTLWTFLHEQRYGKASQTFDFDVAALAEKLAPACGLTPEELLARADKAISDGVN